LATCGGQSPSVLKRTLNIIVWYGTVWYGLCEQDMKPPTQQAPLPPARPESLAARAADIGRNQSMSSIRPQRLPETDLQRKSSSGPLRRAHTFAAGDEDGEGYTQVMPTLYHLYQSTNQTVEWFLHFLSPIQPQEINFLHCLYIYLYIYM